LPTKRTVTVNDKMQKRYRYVRSAPVGRRFDPAFKPQLTPLEMLAQLRAGRSQVPQAPAPGAAALGLRQPQDLAAAAFSADKAKPSPTRERAQCRWSQRAGGQIRS
jgi:hypothetical protein